MQSDPTTGPESEHCPPTSELFRLEALASRGEPVTAEGSGRQRHAAYWTSCQVCTHLLNTIARRDPWTGSVLPRQLQDVLMELSAAVSQANVVPPEDGLQVMASHCLPGLEAVLSSPRRRLLREHELRQLHQVRQIDTASMIWLARQPGRSVQQKIGSRQRALAVVRSADLDTLENRVVRRVAQDLGRLLERRIEALEALEPAAADRERSRVLRSAFALCTNGVADAGLSGIALRDVIQPNNVLLSDPDYHRFWRTWLWLGEHRGSLERSWSNGLERIVMTAFWVLVSEIVVQYGADVLNEDCIPAAGIGHEDFALIRMSAAPDVPVDLWIDHPSPSELHEQTLFRLGLSGTTVHVSYYRVRGSGWVSLGGDEKLVLEGHFDLRFALDHQAPLEIGHHYPLDISLLAHDTNQPLQSFADAQSFRELSLYIAAAVLGEPDADVRGAGSENAWPAAACHLGLDSSGSIPRLISENGAWVPVHLASIQSVRSGESRSAWRTAARDRTFAPSFNPGEWFSLPRMLAAPAASLQDASREDAALHQIFTNLWREVPRAENAELAIAMPAGLPHFLERRLRAAAGRGFSRTWIVERSTAAALGWQTQDNYREAGLRDGDCVLVLDGEAGALRFSLLKACQQGDLANPEEPILWERNLSDPPWPEEKRLCYREWLKEYLLSSAYVMRQKGMVGEHQLDALVDNLIEQGEAERLVEHEHTVRVSHAQDATRARGFLSLHYSPTTAKDTCDWWMDGYREWLPRVRRHLIERIRSVDREQREHGRTPQWHVLYSGRPFQMRSIRDRVERVWRTVLSAGLKGIDFAHHAPDEAHLLAARGAQSFLARHCAGLPTFRDVLPDLFLEVDGEQGPETRQILPRATKQPGESVHLEVAKSLTLPAHESEYVLPVIQGAEGSSISYNALLRPPGFPMRRPLVVKMEVLYRYGEDNYRLFVSPAPGEPRVFVRVEMEWAALVNVVPDFAAPVRNQKIGNKLERLEEALGSLPANVDTVGEQLGSAVAFLQTVRRTFRAPASGPADGSLLARLQEPPFSWGAVLGGLVRLWRTEREGINANPTRSIALREALQEAIVAFTDVMAALDVEAPDDVVDAIAETLGYTGRDDRNITGAALRIAEASVRDSGSRAQRNALAAVVKQLAYRFKRLNLRTPTPELRRLNRPLGTAAVILRADRAFAASMRAKDVQIVLDIVVQGLNAIASALVHLGGGPGEVENTFSAEDHDYLRGILFTFRNSCELLMGLLCLRGAPRIHPEVQAIVQAGAERPRELAKLIAGIDRSFHAPLALSRIPQRVIPEGPRQTRSDMSPLVHALYSYLAGYNPLRLVQVEETSE